MLAGQVAGFLVELGGAGDVAALRRRRASDNFWRSTMVLAWRITASLSAALRAELSCAEAAPGSSARAAIPSRIKAALVMAKSGSSQMGRCNARIYQSGSKWQRGFFLVGLILQDQFVLIDLHHQIIHAAKRHFIADAPAVKGPSLRIVAKIRRIAIHAAVGLVRAKW